MRNGLRWLLSVFGEKKAQKVIYAWKEIFDTTDERIILILNELAIYCNVTSSSFKSGDSHQTAFNEGARDVFLHILEMSEIKIEDILKIIKHNNHI